MFRISQGGFGELSARTTRVLQPACGVFFANCSSLTRRAWPCYYHKQFQHDLLPCPIWACTFPEARLNRKGLSTTRGFAIRKFKVGVPGASPQ